jgi:hypothetical protein
MFYTWMIVSRRDPRAIGLYGRHYSSKKNKKTAKDWRQYGITAPGESLVLLTADVSALFVWVKQIYRADGETGINCAVFRNEGEQLSSSLILEAEKMAQGKWGNERLFTHVDAGAVRRKRDPGRCFKKAGWELVKDENGRPRTTKDGLLIFEKVVA